MFAPGTRRHVRAALKLGANRTGDHDGVRSVRVPGCAGLQSRCADTRRGARRTVQLKPRHL